MRSFPSSWQTKLPSWESVGLLPKLNYWLRRLTMIVMMIIAGKVQTGIWEIIKTRGQRMMSRSNVLENGKGISRRTDWACNLLIFQSLPTLPHKQQLMHGQLQLSLKVYMPTIDHRLVLAMVPDFHSGPGPGPNWTIAKLAVQDVN